MTAILIDDRAGSKDLILHSPLCDHPSCILTRLESADVCITGNGPSGPILIGVEVKSVLDLISSLSSGRLQAEQIPKMLSNYHVSWLLIYGSCRANPDSGTLQILRRVGQGKQSRLIWADYRIGNRTVPYGYLTGFLVSPSFTETGIHSARVSDIEEAAQWIGVLARCWSKPYDKHTSMRVFNKSQPDVSASGNQSGLSSLAGIAMDNSTAIRANLLRAFPGVGYERAISIAKSFPSTRSMIETMMSGNAKRLESISGVGKVIARGIIEEMK